MLLEIFTKMDHKTLLSSMQVNKKWLQVISQTPTTMKNMTLTLHDKDLKNRKVPLLTRKYQTVVIKHCYYYRNNIFKALKEINQTVTELHLLNSFFSDNEFVRIIDCFPLVKNLIVINCYWSSSQTSSTLKVFPSQLTELTIMGDAWMLSHISSQLECFTASRIYHEDHRYLIDFLNSQEKLKSLTLDNISDLFNLTFPNFLNLQPVIFNPKFSLHYLLLKQLPYVDQNELKKLLECAHSCELLSIGYDVPSIVLHYALKNFHNLKYLDIGVEHLPLQTAFYYGLNPNNSLIHLRIDGKLESGKDFLNLIQHYPTVISLDLLMLHGICYKNILWQTISKVLKEIQFLQLKRCKSSTLIDLKFPLMKSLVIEKIGVVNNEAWLQLNKNCPNLRSLIINYVSQEVKFEADKVASMLGNLIRLEFYSCYSYAA